MSSRAKSSPPKKPERQPETLPPEFFLQPVTDVARDLLGKGLLVKQNGKTLLVELVETEAYFQEDPASHSFAGNTKRTWPMFERGGTCYVYVIYGINLCMNVSTGPKGRGEAVLLRAARPLLGQDIMLKNRVISARREVELLNGPGKLTQALGVTLNHNGLTFDRDDFKLVDLGVEIPPENIGRSPRIGITKAPDALLRFYLRDCPWVSRAKVSRLEKTVWPSPTKR